MHQGIFVGLDLGWSTGATGVAATDDQGCLIASGRVRTDEEIAAWIAGLRSEVSVVAVDAPLVVPNESGQRVAERLIGRTFGGFGASAHTSNRATFGGQEPRAMRLAKRFGWEIDPSARPFTDQTVCIEVYPHPAMIGLFGLTYRLDYKKGNVERRRPGFVALMSHLEGIAELAVAGQPRWEEIRDAVASPRPGDLNRVEDELDAIVCARLAWMWHHRRDTLRIYGSADEGYIVAPSPPTHRPVRPLRSTEES